jgi:starch synthase
MPSRTGSGRSSVVLSVLGRLPTLHCAAALAPSVRVITDVRPAHLATDHVPPSVVESLRPQVVALTAAAHYARPPLKAWLGAARGEFYDVLAARRLGDCDVLDCWSSSSLRTMMRGRQAGAFIVLNRGSTHILHQKGVLVDEYARWGIREHLPASRTIERELKEYEQADLIVVPSAQAAETFVQHGFSAEKVRVNVTGVDLARFAPASTSGQAGGSGFTLVYVGVDAIRKGLPDALEGWVLAGRPGRFVVVSSAPRWLMQRYRTHGVEFRGPDRNVGRLLSTATAFLFPSLEEGHARILLEVLASGVPVIATRESGACDFPDSPAVTIVPTRDPDAIARAIESVRVTGNLAEVRLAARRIAVAFTWERYVTEHLSFYPAAARGSQGPEGRP